MPASSASARKNGGGVYACGGEIRSNVYPAGYDIGDKTLYAIDAPVVNIEGGVVEGNIYNGSIIKVGVPPQIGEENKKRTSISEKNLI